MSDVKERRERLQQERKELLDMEEYWEKEVKKYVNRGDMETADQASGLLKRVRKQLRDHRNSHPEVKED